MGNGKGNASDPKTRGGEGEGKKNSRRGSEVGGRGDTDRRVQVEEGDVEISVPATLEKLCGKRKRSVKKKQEREGVNFGILQSADPGLG